MKISFLIAIASISLLVSCKGTKAQQRCLDKYIEEISTDTRYNLIRSAARDTVAQWSHKNLKFFAHFIDQVEWQIDSTVFFNEDKDKALLLLLKVYKKQNAKMDFVSMIAAEKKEGEWHFYNRSMPNMAFPRNLNQNTPYTFEKLSEVAQEELIRGGFYKKGTCEINYDYINDWFKRPLAEYHQEFLRNKIE